MCYIICHNIAHKVWYRDKDLARVDLEAHISIADWR